MIPIADKSIAEHPEQTIIGDGTATAGACWCLVDLVGHWQVGMYRYTDDHDGYDVQDYHNDL